MRNLRGKHAARKISLSHSSKWEAGFKSGLYSFKFQPMRPLHPDDEVFIFGNKPACSCLCAKRHTCYKIHDLEERHRSWRQETGFRPPPCDFNKSRSSWSLSVLIYRMKFLIPMCFSLSWSLFPLTLSLIPSFSTPDFPLPWWREDASGGVGRWVWTRHRKGPYDTVQSFIWENGEREEGAGI